MAEETDAPADGSANFSEPFALGHVLGQPMAPQTLPDELPQSVDEGVLGQSAEAFGKAAAATCWNADVMGKPTKYQQYPRSRIRSSIVVPRRVGAY